MIIHPLFKLMMRDPHLIGEHMQAYAALVGDEAKKVSVSIAVRIGLYAGAGVLAAIGLLLIGVALLIRASISPVNYPAGWALVFIPLTPFIAAALMVLVARSKPIEKAFDVVKRQVKTDMDILKEVSSS